jgi:uncharacterized protein YoxC
MSEPAVWVLVALAAVLVGAAVPALLQLRRTLKAAELTLESTGRRVNETLDSVKIAMERVNRAADGLEQGVARVSSLLEALGGIGDALVKVKSSIGTVASVGSVVGSAVMAALGFRSRKRDPGPDREQTQEEEVDAR